MKTMRLLIMRMKIIASSCWAYCGHSGRCSH